MMEVAAIESINICSRRRDSAERLAEEVQTHYGIPCELASPEKAISESSLICACTTSDSPLFDGSNLKPGTHINAVGSFTQSTREVDTESVRRSRVIIDAESAAGREAGDILIPISEGAIKPDHIVGSLADVVSGRVAGRTSPEEITLFKSCGHAIEDLVTARLAFEIAQRRGEGLRVEL
jgi:ornithine cyclodeaminase/alanine dehydrogenase-like protein (mu-crystallin family)